MVVGLVLGALFVTPLVIMYLLVIRWADRFEPEPWWLVLSAFVWGAVFATLGGGLSSQLAEGATSHVFGRELMDVVGATVFAPIFEETFKGLGVTIIAVVSAAGLRELDGPLDGVIYGGVVGLGFTLTEDILYVANQYQTGGVIGFVSLLFLRTVLLGLSHCTFTACTGLGFGIAAEARSLGVKIGAPIAGFASAIGMHALHNLLPTVFAGAGLAVMLVISWVIDLVFFFLLAILVVRDRHIVLRELFDEVGALTDARELRMVTSYFALSMRNLSVLFGRGHGAFRERKRKQRQLVELAFLKYRRRRGRTGPKIDRKEAELRREIALATERGVVLSR